MEIVNLMEDAPWIDKMYSMIEEMQTGQNWKEHGKSRSENLRIFYYNKQDGYKHCSTLCDCVIAAPFAESM